jgi:uncharacterized protein (DUF952 family)
MEKRLYRIMTPAQWDQAQRDGQFVADEYKEFGYTYAC